MSCHVRCCRAPSGCGREERDRGHRDGGNLTNIDAMVGLNRIGLHRGSQSCSESNTLFNRNRSLLNFSLNYRAIGPQPQSPTLALCLHGFTLPELKFCYRGLDRAQEWAVTRIFFGATKVAWTMEGGTAVGEHIKVGG